MFTIGQQVAVKNSQQRGLTLSDTRKVMEIAAVVANGYKLRRIGSSSKGGQIVYEEESLEAI